MDVFAEIVEKIVQMGGQALLVGGAVRDKLLGRPVEDRDVEVYGMAPQQLIELLSEFGDVDCVGRSFGVIKLSVDGEEIDFSLPRRESKAGAGHKGFIIEPDPSMTPYEAARRRDFTINSMAIDLATGAWLDFFGGKRDFKRGILRATSEKFREDPLRVLRGMQFAGRFGMTVEEETARMARSLREEYAHLAVERIWEEWWKWAVKSVKPSCGLCFLMDVGWLSLYPALFNLVGLRQDPEWHPEGTAWRHTLLSVDAAAEIAQRDELSEEDRAVLIFSVLLHDVGKAVTTAEAPDGRIRSEEHGQEGVRIAQEFLESIGAWTRIVETVLPLVREHMFPLFASNVSRTGVRRLSNRLHPATIAQLLRVVEADCKGGLSKEGVPEGARRLGELSEQLDLQSRSPVPILMGRHLMAHLDMKPGPHLGPILKAAFQAQLDGEFSTLEEAVEWAREYVARR